MLDLKLPKQSYVFLRKHLEEGVYQVSAVSTSDVLKRNTDSLRCAVENDVFASLPQDSLWSSWERGIRCNITADGVESWWLTWWIAWWVSPSKLSWVCIMGCVIGIIIGCDYEISYC